MASSPLTEKKPSADGSRGIRLSDRILIAGQTGKGKTTLALYIMAQLQPIRTIVFDPKAQLRFGDLQPVSSPGKLAKELKNKPFVHYVPRSFDRDTLEDACMVVWSTPGPWLWDVDETSELTSPNYCPEGLRLAVTQGRQTHRMVMACTQRLAESHPVFRSQSEHMFVFVPPPIELDLKAIAGNMYREVPLLQRELSSLHAEHGDYSHLWFCRDTDELRRCAPIPIEEAKPAPPRERTVIDEVGR